MDWIRIRGLELRTILGANEEERREKQDVVVNLGLFTDLSEAMRTDDLRSAVDYRAVKKAVLQSAERSSHQLSEALAARIAAVCLSFPGVKEVAVSVEKPSALRFARSVAIEITRSCDEMAQAAVFVGVGSNIDPERQIPEALKRLGARTALRAVSTFYRTEALGGRFREPFVNGVVEIMTPLQPDDLKALILSRIEDELGRRRTSDKSADRTIDLDILLYDDRIIPGEELRIPDPAITDRAFLAVPLAELAPERILPGTPWSLGLVGAHFRGHQMIPLPELTERLRREAGL